LVFIHVPPFYLDNGESVHPVALSAFLLSFNNKTFCPNGQIVKTTTNFQLYNKNGSMKTTNADDTLTNKRKAGEFGVDRIMTQQ
jgi:hypothetical protein